MALTAKQKEVLSTFAKNGIHFEYDEEDRIYRWMQDYTFHCVELEFGENGNYVEAVFCVVHIHHGDSYSLSSNLDTWVENFDHCLSAITLGNFSF